MIVEQLASIAKSEGLNAYSICEICRGEMKTVRVNPANDYNDIFSCSKNFAATAVGFLVDDGKLSLSDTVGDLFRDDYPEFAEKWEKVEVRHVLTQTIGINRGWLDIDNDDVWSYPTTDYLRYVLSAPLPFAPGERFTYSDSNFYLASRIAAKVSGERTQDFLNRRLFMPLHFQGQAWSTDPDGHAIGGTGLFLKVQDMAKLGWLYLNRGVWEGKRLLSEEWCDLATSSLVTVNEQEKIRYGYSFWRFNDVSAYQGNGMNGQVIYVSPKKELVVAWQFHDVNGGHGRLCNYLLAQEAE